MEGKKSCPSAPFKVGHSVFGKFNGDQIKFTDELITIDKQMIEDSLKTEFRATMPCVTKGCVNWTGKKCSVPDQMSYFIDPQADLSDYSNCSLRPTCRWYAENGEAACKICPLIRTQFLEI